MPTLAMRPSRSDPPDIAETLRLLTEQSGGKIRSRMVVRMPIEYYAALEEAIRVLHMSGRLVKEVSQGRPAFVTFEEV